jgi:two-component system sensor histidine kinase VicK
MQVKHRVVISEQHLFQKAPVGIVLLDRDNRIVSINKLFKETFRYNLDYAVHDIMEMVHPDDVPFYTSQVTQLYAGEMAAFTLEHRLRTKAGHYKWVSVASNIAYNKAGNFLHRIEYLTVIAEPRIKEVQQADAKPRDYLAAMSHDLKNPLNQIMLSAELLEAKLKNTLTDEQKSLFNILRSGCVNAVGMIHDLQEARDLENGKMPFNNQRATIKEFFEPLAEKYHSMVENKGFRLKTVLPHENVKFVIDRELITNVLDNIMSNALKYSHLKDPILLEVAVIAGMLDISVTDIGIGIIKENQPFVFEKFSRAKRKGLRGERSTGLGMYISKMIVEEHGGDISFESMPGMVTTFRVRLPIK